MNLSKKPSKVIKSQNIVLVDQEKAASPEFTRMRCESADEDGAAEGGQIVSRSEQVRRDMEASIERGKKTSFKAGHAEGFREGVEKQKQEALLTVQALTATIEEMGRIKQDILEGAEEEILSLAFAIAEKVIHQEILSNRDVIRSTLKEAIRNIVDKEELKIRLNPEDFHYMMEIKNDFFQAIEGVKNVVFEEDGAVGKGGAIVESLFGEVDARVDKQFEQIKTKLAGDTDTR